MSDGENGGLSTMPGELDPVIRVDELRWRAIVNHRLDQGSKKMRDMSTALEENTKVTERVEANTAEVVELLESFKGAMKVLTMLGKLAKPLTAITVFIGALAGLLALWKSGGNLPK